MSALELTPIEKAKQRLLAIKQAAAAKQALAEREIAASRVVHVQSLSTLGWSLDTSKPWNAEQLDAINMALSRKSFCLIGAAGTGKTSTLKGAVNSLLRNHLLAPISAGKSTKWLRAGTPGMVLIAFTNMAVRQVAKHFTGEITCVTAHKLLEFIPEKYEGVDDKGNIVTKMRFVPSRNKLNPLPRELTTIVIDESSMFDTSLFELLVDALPDPASVQFIFLGDLNQLPPVYGGPILGRKLLELPVVELTRVYRQALESPIISLATDMKDGKLIPVGTEKRVIDNGAHGKATIHPWGKALSSEDALNKAESFCKGALNVGAYDPMQDMILCPFNVNFGVLALNLAIADYLGRQRGAEVIEVVAGFETHYFAVGDKLLVQKREALITKIVRNPRYAGKKPVDTNKYTVDRYGGCRKKEETEGLVSSNDFDSDEFDVDAFMDSLQITTIEQRVTAASHHITVEFLDSEDDEGKNETTVLQSASEVNETLFAYAITVHKSQGSEWRKVFFFLHASHSQMCSRELVYTGMTRAKSELYIICEPDRAAKTGTLSKAAKTPRLKGNNLAEKLVSLKERFEKEAKESQGKRLAEDE